MGKPFYERFSDIFKPKDQTDGKFLVYQLDNCWEALRDAYAAATQDESGKPIFFYVERPSAGEDAGNVVSLHYIDASLGELRNLNFIAHVITDLKMDEPTIGLTLNERYKTGADVIARLAECAVFARKNPNCITARRV